ncbi:MAG: hypothetical protein Q4C63_02505 [Eubacteriales bacterium]|nr:hypothetical protein [Eubacteriales bacterium]
MAEANDRRGLLLQNLEDAGCDEETVQKCMAMAEKDDAGGLLRLLSCHKKVLLQMVHTKQKEIDCLDYLIYNIEKLGGNLK